MFAGARGVAGGIAALLCAHCGYFGVELLPAEVVVADGGRDAGVVAEIEDAGSVDAPPTSEDASSLDAFVDDAANDDAAVDDATVDAYVADANVDASGADASVDAGPVRCELAGDWVAQLRIATSWAAGAVLPGSGTTTIWLRYQASATGGIVAGSLIACGASLPSTTTPTFETYAPRFADSVFDTLPPRVVATNASFGLSGSGFPGDVVTLAPVAFVFGTTLADPVASGWPLNSLLPANDQDVDGQPGTTVDFTGSIHPPVDGQRRAAQGYIAARIAFGGNASVVDCSTLMGPVTVSRFDTHFVGCALDGGGSCSASQRDFLDLNRPLYAAGSSTLTARKVPNATCPIARSTLP